MDVPTNSINLHQPGHIFVALQGNFYFIYSLPYILPASIGHQPDSKRIVPLSRYKSDWASSSARWWPWPGILAPHRSRGAWRSDHQGSSCAANKLWISRYFFSLFFPFTCDNNLKCWQRFLTDVFCWIWIFLLLEAIKKLKLTLRNNFQNFEENEIFYFHILIAFLRQSCLDSSVLKFSDKSKQPSSSEAAAVWSSGAHCLVFSAGLSGLSGVGFISTFRTFSWRSSLLLSVTLVQEEGEKEE